MILTANPAHRRQDQGAKLSAAQACESDWAYPAAAGPTAPSAGSSAAAAAGLDAGDLCAAVGTRRGGSSRGSPCTSRHTSQAASAAPASPLKVPLSRCTLFCRCSESWSVPCFVRRHALMAKGADSAQTKLTGIIPACDGCAPCCKLHPERAAAAVPIAHGCSMQ